MRYGVGQPMVSPSVQETASGNRWSHRRLVGGGVIVVQRCNPRVIADGQRDSPERSGAKRISS